ncbi:hypothetical protein I302_106797 [Kwoniella bestiolae CBS 10118]|uniref:histidine kinase n=1 Tax=Kwoniella bestiolae CBS 10118 TaxID=1296100 RepID=A0A1B9G0D9_9TREE|nr:hypothetical protein I302_05937 [Kwoniella bestiolae CBS 10118]OCF24477.1 hypothetical protein I302_05937 [Kwoniella bestiolae CBS 10118]
MCQNEAIPFSETPPLTEEEWTEALKCYARDRESSSGGSSSIIEETHDQHWAVTLPPPTQNRPHFPRPPPLVHHGDSDDSLDASIGGNGVPFTRPENIPGPFRHLETAAEHPPHIQAYDKPKDYDFNEQNSLSGSNPIPVAFDTARTALGPKGEEEFQDDDRRSAKNERKRMKTHYQEHGWLPGPTPSKSTRLKRRRAIRRLGLVGEEEDGRKAVLSKYAEMAELVFDIPQSLVAIIHDETEFVYSSDPDKPSESRPTPQTACSHVIDIHDGDCWVIADCTKDWRTKNNPLFEDKHFRFFAAAPLRYHGKDGSLVDLGTLNIYDVKARYSFSQRERSLLLKLSNMLVYQLATLQSEYMAKRASAMYEASITFLRRSLIPEPSGSKRRYPSRKRSSSSFSGSSSGLSGPSAPLPPPPHPSSQAKMAPPDTSDSTQVASKAGPRDSRDARRQAIVANQNLYDDAANTLRQLLKADAVAVVNLEDYQLFMRKQSSSGGSVEGKKGKSRIETKEKIINDYLKGEPWPADVEPVINYGGRQSGTEILGFSANDPRIRFRLDADGVESVLAEFLRVYFATRRFWWDREENEDPLSSKIMNLMPPQAQTALGTTFMGHDGKIKFVMFATWNEPPSSLVDSSLVALPFIWILGGCLIAALAMKKIRALEQSQISYSNIQAHELRTPLHQILGITQLLRSSVNDIAETPRSPGSVAGNEQVKGLLPFLDAVDTSNKTLHGIVDNILSFLDLKGKEDSNSLGDNGLLTTPVGTQTSLEVLIEEIIQEAIEEDGKSRKANGQPICKIETIFEIIPPLLGEQVSEDAGGALRRALGKVLGHAYKFIDSDGCVEIYIDDVVDLLPPEDCEEIAMTKFVSITIKDDGRGMHQAFVNDKLGEPWAKENQHATGSGLSVHLAYRIIDLMGGCMEISSAPRAGTTVQIDVPLPLRSMPFPESHSEPGCRRGSTASIRQLKLHHEQMDIDRKVCFAGFSDNGPRIEMVGEALNRQYAKIGCEIVTNAEDAQLVVAFGGIEENREQAEELFQRAHTQDIVFLITNEHSAHEDVLELEKEMNLQVRRFKRPMNPSILRETLFPNHSERLRNMFDEENDGEKVQVDSGAINTPHLMSPEGNDQGRPSDQRKKHASPVSGDLNSFGRPDWSFPPGDHSAKKDTQYASKGGSGNRNPSNMKLEEAMASLSTGEYFPSVSPKQKYKQELELAQSPVEHGDNDTTPKTEDTEPNRRHPVTTEQASEREASSFPDTASTSITSDSGPSSVNVPLSGRNGTGDGKSEAKANVKVLVVEDNKINRTLLVKLLQKQIVSPKDILEAEDGQEAIDIFKTVSGPLIVLLDINMPRKDGYQTSIEMRMIEKDNPDRQRAQIVAVTALASADEKKKGLVECNMDDWYSKPCGKSVISLIISNACQKLSA